ncbi:M90 family metallopeptidase [Ramlibacter sp. MAHUQ-53]|uniref:M90 family metallopeptidase n=1 Tax=unclassified Ramlibacter TaxID=2617605 RepID=UPI003644FFD8
MFGWWRRRRTAPAIPEDLWLQVLADFPFLAQRPAADLTRLRELAARFLRDKEFHGAQGLVITDALALSIAAQAVLPVLHLGLGWYDDFVGIVVHPDEVVARRSAVDEAGVVHDWDEVLAGEAMERGPVMLSWRDVREAGQGRDDGYNVVVHEFVHKLDMRDGASDGCPPLPSRAARQAWLSVMQAEYEAFRERVVIAERFGGEPTWLDPYGAQSVDEFFAVACEAYFVQRERFATEFPVLVPLFDGFFGPKPAA